MTRLTFLSGLTSLLTLLKATDAFLPNTFLFGQRGFAAARAVSESGSTCTSQVSMKAGEGMTRGEFSRQTVATILAGITAGANVGPSLAAGKRGLSSPSAAVRGPSLSFPFVSPIKEQNQCCAVVTGKATRGNTILD
ncbi:unnamed protein product [Choristocarpus tenellus]